MGSPIESVAYWQRYVRRNAFVFGKGFTPKRFVNFLMIEAQQRRFSESVRGKPYSVFIDPVNVCVLQCPLCGTGRGEVARARQRMPAEDFIRYLAPLADTLYSVKLYNYGEPFLNPELPAMVRWCRERRIATQVNSNLNVLTPQQADEIVDAGLDRLVVSFDGLSQEAYRSYRRGGSIDAVRENLDLINLAKGKRDRRYPEIILQYLITRHNEHEYNRIRDFAASVKAQFFPQPITIDPKNNEQVVEWLPSNDEYTHYLREGGIKKKSRPDRHCGFLWNDIVINVDGGISPCCHLYYKSTDFGNLNEAPFGRIWNNEHFRTARRLFRERRIIDPESVCGRCIDPRAFESAAYDLVNEHRTNDIGR